ncbi:unnamed protein product [Effrenium voratum]|nr:unnamed protein product [Effrenium voratum]
MGGGSSKIDAHRKNFCKVAITGSTSWKDKEDKMLETFKTWDKDGSGFISKEELQEVFTRLGCKVSASELGKVLKDADADKDSKISYEEFVAWLCRAPHLEHYFKLTEDIVKRNFKDVANETQKLQKELDKSSDPFSGIMKMGQKLEAIQKKAQARIDKELTPVIKKTFAYHDKDNSGALTYDESIIFFSNYAERLGPFMESTAELATGQMMSMTDIKASPNALHEEFKKKFAPLKQDYQDNMDKKHKAAFECLDVNKDGKLQESEVIEALLPGHPKNEQFMKALGLMVAPETMGGEGIKVEMDMEECPMQ